MRKSLVLVFGVLFSIAITSCSKTSVEPVTPVTPIFPAAIVPLNNIVILGGSTAWGKGASAIEYTWVHKLRAKLKAVDKKDTIINLAFPGYTTYHILATGTNQPAKRPDCDTTRNITTALSKKPMLVIISLPSNDIANGYPNEEILDNYKTIVKTLVRENIPYILTSNQPRSFDIEQRAQLRTFSTLLAKTFPGHVVDYLDQLGDNGWYYKPMYSCGDGIHPNDRGHEVIYNSFINFAPFKKIVGLN